MTDEFSDIVCVRSADVGTAMITVPTAGPLTWPSSPGTAANEVQTVALTGAPTGGDFTLTYDAVESGAIPFDATVSELEEILESMSSIGEGNVDVSGTDGGPWTVTFIRDLGNQNIAIMTKDATGLTGGTTPNVTITETTAGAAGGGVWASVPNVDPEQALKIGWDSRERVIFRAGGAGPARKHVLALYAKSFEFQTTESGSDAIRFMFPSLADDVANRRIALRAKSVEASYKAVVVEVTAGVYEFKKCAPMQDSELSYTNKDIVQPTVVLQCFENDSNVIGYFHYFE